MASSKIIHSQAMKNGACECEILKSGGVTVFTWLCFFFIYSGFYVSTKQQGTPQASTFKIIFSYGNIEIIMAVIVCLMDVTNLQFNLGPQNVTLCVATRAFIYLHIANAFVQPTAHAEYRNTGF